MVVSKKLRTFAAANRDLAQLVAHTSGGREVAGSSPVIPTNARVKVLVFSALIFLIELHRDNKNRQHPVVDAACCCFNKSNPHYETSMALVTFSFGSVFGMVMVRMPSSTLAEI